MTGRISTTSRTICIAGLFLSLCADCIAATLTVQPGQPIPQGNPGDTVVFAPGNYGAWEQRANGVTYKGMPGAVFALGGRDIIVRGHDVRFEGFEFTGGRVDLANVRNVTFENNTFRDWGGNAVIGRNGSDGLKFIRNKWRNITGYGIVEIYSAKNPQFKFNEITNCNHGGHWLGATNGVFANNWAEGLTDWLFEVQDAGSLITQGNTFENNVALNYRKGYGNTGGIGMPGGQANAPSRNNIIRNNYLRASFSAGAPMSENRLHVAIEVTNWWEGAITNNTIGSDRTDNYVWQSGVGYKTPAGTTGNRWFGRFGTGYGGFGKPLNPWPVAGNSWDTNVANMPPPPKKSDVLGGVEPTPEPPDPEPEPEPEPPPTTQPVTITITSPDYKPATVTLEPK